MVLTLCLSVNAIVTDVGKVISEYDSQLYRVQHTSHKRFFIWLTFMVKSFALPAIFISLMDRQCSVSTRKQTHVQNL